MLITIADLTLVRVYMDQAPPNCIIKLTGLVQPKLARERVNELSG